MSVCKKLGLSVHPGECVGPSTQLIVLGIELDLVELCARIPGEKLAALQDLISSWRSRWWRSRQELESLIGHLQHEAKVVWPGRTFLRRMIDLLCCFCRRDHPIRLNAEFHLDLLWWHEFLSSWHVSCLGPWAYSRCCWFFGSFLLYGISVAESQTFLLTITQQWWARRNVCHSQATYLQLRENGAGPLFYLQDGGPLSRALLTDWLGRF